MPHFERFSTANLKRGEQLFPDWTKRPFPSSWGEFEATVIEWLELAWPDWKCPHCSHEFWQVLEAVRLDSAVSWPIAESSSFGSYPIVPVACTWCKQVTPVLLFSIFESPPHATDGPTTST